MRGYGIPPIAEEEERKPGATLEVDEIRRRIEEGEIKKEQFTSVELERLGYRKTGPIRSSR